jgi:hypothetical protein
MSAAGFAHARLVEGEVGFCGGGAQAELVA